MREHLLEVCTERPDLQVASVSRHRLRRRLMKNAFRCDYGLVETVAHFTAARAFMPDVDFIIDIGGQDMKCLAITDGVIDNIFLNEACSSGCGSFLQTFARPWAMTIEEFANLGCWPTASGGPRLRCTVFMNSSVKQAQKDGASVEDISAGLSISPWSKRPVQGHPLLHSGELGRTSWCRAVRSSTTPCCAPLSRRWAWRSSARTSPADGRLRCGPVRPAPEPEGPQSTFLP